MKIRTCFVSNSSSCSSIVFIPEGFKPDWSKYQDLMDENEVTESAVEDVWQNLLAEGCIWEEENYEVSSVLKEMLSDNNMIIAGVDCSSDAGQIVVADKNKIKKLMAQEIK